MFPVLLAVVTYFNSRSTTIYIFGSEYQNTTKPTLFIYMYIIWLRKKTFLETEK